MAARGVGRMCAVAAEWLYNLEEPALYWRREKATRAGLIVDADAYFAAGALGDVEGRRRIMLIGWDFDARIGLLSDERLPGEPRTLGEFVLWLVARNPKLEVFSTTLEHRRTAHAVPGIHDITLAIAGWRTRGSTRGSTARSPIGASHHHKIVVVDDSLAFCGGIDMTSNRWDTPAHLDDDPRRVAPDGSPYAPWHDVTSILEGPVAAALGELAGQRWQAAGGKALPPVTDGGDCWPETSSHQFHDISVAICRSRPGGRRRSADSRDRGDLSGPDRRRQRYVYAESQYFVAPHRRGGGAAAGRARRAGNHRGQPLQVSTAGSSRSPWIRPVPDSTWRCGGSIATGGSGSFIPIQNTEPIYVHAKATIVDDQVLHVGSSNRTTRSLRLDTECTTSPSTLGGPGNEGHHPRSAAPRQVCSPSISAWNPERWRRRSTVKPR